MLIEHIFIFSVLTFLTFAAFAVKVQTPVFHGTLIRGGKHPKKCEYKLNLHVKENLQALVEKMSDKQVKRVWVSENKVAVLHKNGSLDVEKALNRKALRQRLSYICGTKPESLKKRRKEIIVVRADETEFIEPKPSNKQGEEEKRLEKVTSPLPGMLHKVSVQPGDQVQAGDDLVIVESMKMLTAIKAPTDGRVEGVPVHAGESVSPDQTLIFLGPPQ